VYYLLPEGRNFFLLCASYVFYGWWDPWFAFLMLFATAINYSCGEIISRSPFGSRRRYLGVLLSVVTSLSTLGFFKYFMFFQENLNRLLAFWNGPVVDILQITLPIGISFYIFQSLSYTIDVYRGESPPVRSFSDFACFVALFPQLIAGPIVRYNTIADQLVARTHTLEKFSSGTALFILGFAKKILLANSVGEIADTVFEAEAPYMLDAWFGVIAYAFQIYFDFSAYSDMAIGLGRMVGFEFPRNFNAPYLADSITDFWRRWHISLSTFLRDYLYIPLGGNKKGARRTYINLALVMLLGGLWHGASWVFVIWGAYHGALLAFERWRGKESLYSRLPRPVRVAMTFVLVLFSWVLFRCPTLDSACVYFSSMFAQNPPYAGSVLLAGEIFTQGSFIMMTICTVLAFQPLQAFDWVKNITWFKVVLLIPLFVLALCTMFVQAFNPFLYFQF
jgi:alginate O-acetyltransferase complex protein AlgI